VIQRTIRWTFSALGSVFCPHNSIWILLNRFRRTSMQFCSIVEISRSTAHVLAPWWSACNPTSQLIIRAAVSSHRALKPDGCGVNNEDIESDFFHSGACNRCVTKVFSLKPWWTCEGTPSRPTSLVERQPIVCHMKSL
jgi:hypothetical protein